MSYRFLMGVCPGGLKTRWAVVLQRDEHGFSELFGAGEMRVGEFSSSAGYVRHVVSAVETSKTLSDGFGSEFRLGIERGIKPRGLRCGEILEKLSDTCLRFEVSEFRFESPIPRPAGLGEMGYVTFGETNVWADPELIGDLKTYWRAVSIAVRAGESDPDDAVSRSF